MAIQSTEYLSQSLIPAHPGLRNGAGIAAGLAAESYIESLARILYYWGYPAVNTFGRTSSWAIMKDGPGATMGLFPGAPKNTMGYLDDVMASAQRKVVTPNRDTIYGAGFMDLAEDAVVIQAPDDVPAGHYWTIQIVDLFTTVIHQLGSASHTLGGKYLLVGPDWEGRKPEGIVDVLHSPTHIAAVFGRSFAGHGAQGMALARRVLNQIGVVPLRDDRPGPLVFDCEASARNAVFPPGVTHEMVTADPDLLRVRPVNAATFWDDLEKALDASPKVCADDAPMAAQARALLALRRTSSELKSLIDHVALAADAELQEGARYYQTGVDTGNGWQRQRNAGAWGADWYGRAQAAVIYIYVNDFHEAIYFIRGTDAAGQLLEGRYHYTLTFPKDGLPAVDRARGGFWSLTMYDEDYYMLAHPEGGRTNIGTAAVDANEVDFAKDGSLALHLSFAPPEDAAARKNWLPAPDGKFALLIRAYVPKDDMANGTYTLPNVIRT
jgi:hypothetical protein